MIINYITNHLLKNNVLDHKLLGFLPFCNSQITIMMLYHDILQAKREKKFILELSHDLPTTLFTLAALSLSVRRLAY